MDRRWAMLWVTGTAVVLASCATAESPRSTTTPLPAGTTTSVATSSTVSTPAVAVADVDDSETHVIEALIAALNERNIEAYRTLLAADVRYEEPGSFTDLDEVVAFREWVFAWQQDITIDACSKRGDGGWIDCVGAWDDITTRAIGLPPCPVTYSLVISSGVITDYVESTDCNYYGLTWVPFQSWIRITHPDDELVMFSTADDTDNHSMYLTDESIELWEQRLVEWTRNLGGDGA